MDSSTLLPTGPLPADWDIKILADATSKIGSGATPRGGAEVYVDSGTAFIRSQNVRDHRFDDQGLVYLDEQAAEALKGVTVNSGDVLLNITGDSILRCCVVPDWVLPARVSQHVAIIRSDGQVAPLLIQKYLTLPAVKEFMLAHSAGGTRKAVTKGHIESFPIPVPPVGDQEALEEFFAAIDSKLESNQRQIALLDERTQLAWQQMFVDGADPAWRNGTLSELADTQYGFTASASDDPVGPKFLRVMDINKRNWITWESVPQAEIALEDYKKYRLNRGDIVVARMADPGKAAIIESDVDAIFASYLVRLVAKRPSDAYFIYGFLKSRAYEHYTHGAIGGSVQKNMNARVIVAAPLAVPPEADRDAYADRVSEDRQFLNQLLSENGSLEAMRDGMGAPLMTGKLSMKPGRSDMTMAEAK